MRHVRLAGRGTRCRTRGLRRNVPRPTFNPFLLRNRRARWLVARRRARDEPGWRAPGFALAAFRVALRLFIMLRIQYMRRLDRVFPVLPPELQRLIFRLSIASEHEHRLAMLFAEIHLDEMPFTRRMNMYGQYNGQYCRSSDSMVASYSLYVVARFGVPVILI